MKHHNIELLIEYLEGKAKEREISYERKMKVPFWQLQMINNH